MKILRKSSFQEVKLKVDQIKNRIRVKVSLDLSKRKIIKDKVNRLKLIKANS